jgi:glycosyl transferase family 25
MPQPQKQQAPLFVISLPEDAERRRPLISALNQLNFSYEIFAGIRAKAMPLAELAGAYDSAKALRMLDRHLTAGELGCALSHIGVYRKMVADDIAHAVVLEDDAHIVDPDFAATLTSLAQNYAGKEATVVLLHQGRYQGFTGTPLDSERKVYKPYRPWIAIGYFLNQAAARSLADNIFPIHTVADHWGYFSERGLISIKTLVPYAVSERPDNHSRIDDIDGGAVRRVAKKRGPMASLQRQLQRIRFSLFKRPFLHVCKQPLRSPVFK